ncbi:hypothetical protein Ancab_018856, partial [Ancistrocladus abbreviatus]
TKGDGPDSLWANTGMGQGDKAYKIESPRPSSKGMHTEGASDLGQPKSDRAKCRCRKSPKGSKKLKTHSKSKARVLKGDSSAAPSRREVESLLSGILIGDSNIENRNRVILGTLNHVTAEEFWAVGKRLRVR